MLCFHQDLATLKILVTVLQLASRGRQSRTEFHILGRHKDPSTWDVEAGRSDQFKVILGCIVTWD